MYLMWRKKLQNDIGSKKRSIKATANMFLWHFLLLFSIWICSGKSVSYAQWSCR